MIGHHYRFTVYNNCGQDIPAAGVVINRRGKKIDSSAALVFEASEAAVFSNGSTIVQGAYASSNPVDNSTNKFIEADITVGFTAPALVTGGELTVYYETSTDGGTTWPTNGRGTKGCTIPVTAPGPYIEVFTIQ